MYSWPEVHERQLDRQPGPGAQVPPLAKALEAFSYTSKDETQRGPQSALADTDIKGVVPGSAAAPLPMYGVLARSGFPQKIEKLL